MVDCVASNPVKKSIVGSLIGGSIGVTLGTVLSLIIFSEEINAGNNQNLAIFSSVGASIGTMLALLVICNENSIRKCLAIAFDRPSLMLSSN